MFDKAAAAPAAPAANVAEFTVSELSGAIKRSLEEGFEHVRVRGELGRISRPGSGHVYLDLKDDRSVLAAVIWKGTASRLRVKPEQGMEVIATGRITTFPGQSKYQLVIEALEPAGLGALMALLEARKKKLAEEGLFDEARKQPLPFLPRVVGIVTSPTGAVIRDMLHGFDERFPTRVVVWPVRVQGESCAAEVAAAVRGFNALAPGGRVPRPDVIIVARGGGSLEDLWGFNEEIAVRAVAESSLPVISAVGHETDWTLIDLAADARAPTPTKAAEWAVPRHADLVRRTLECRARLVYAVLRATQAARDRLKGLARGLPRRETLLEGPRQRFDSLERRLPHALKANTARHATRHIRASTRLDPRLIAHRIGRCQESTRSLEARACRALMRIAGQRRARFEREIGRLRPASLANRLSRAGEAFRGLEARHRSAMAVRLDATRRHLVSMSKLLSSLSYQGVLERGFALIRDADGAPVRRAGEAAPGSRLEIEFADGRLAVRDERAPRPRSPEGSGPPAGGGRPAIVRPATPSDNQPGDEPPEEAGPRSAEPLRPSRKPARPDQGSLF